MTKIKTRKIGLLIGASLLLAGTGVVTAMTTTSCGNDSDYGFVGRADGSDWAGYKGGWVTINFNLGDTCWISRSNGYKAKDLVIPEYVRNSDDNKIYCIIGIGNEAFKKNEPPGIESLTGSLTIPSSINTIGGNAFQECSGLDKIEIGKNVETIGNTAFNGCTGLRSIKLNISGPMDSWASDTFANIGNTQKGTILAPNWDSEKTPLQFLKEHGLSDNWE